jgi:hypothetical protein
VRDLKMMSTVDLKYNDLAVGQVLLGIQIPPAA